MNEKLPPQKNPIPKRGFVEARFMEHFEKLIDEGRANDALNDLITVLPNIGHAGMNREEKLKHLTFLGRMLQVAGLGKYGVRRLAGLTTKITAIVDEYGVSNKNTFFDFGCGCHEPLGLSTYFYANGFERCIANDFLPVRNPRFSAMSMYDLLSYMSNFPEEFLALGQDREAFLERLSRFDAKRLHDGDFDGGVASLDGEVNFYSSDIVDVDVKPGSVSLLVSFAVFEHVMEIEKVCDYLFQITEEGGLHYHSIDLADHRFYRNDGVYNKFTFLTEEEGPSNINRLRASEQVAAFECAGFEILSKEVEREAVPEQTQNAMLPKWRGMSEEDQQTTGITLVLRKPRTN